MDNQYSSRSVVIAFVIVVAAIIVGGFLLISTRPEPVEDTGALDAKKYGVIVECGWRRGLLLPDLEGVDTPQEQIDICCQKGGISPDEPVQLYRFEVKRYK